jgi:hypothetical protein
MLTTSERGHALFEPLHGSLVDGDGLHALYEAVRLSSLLRGRPLRLLCLWDIMRQLKLDNLVNLTSWLSSIHAFSQSQHDLRPDLDLDPPSFERLKNDVDNLCLLLRKDELDLPASRKSGQRLSGLLSQRPRVPRHVWLAALDQFLVCINDEVESVAAWQVSRNDMAFFDKELFGGDVHGRFLAANDDIEEAGKCTGLGRDTACVFHLMRVMEVGLRSLGKSLNNPNLDPARNPSWETILRPCDEELKKPLNRRCPEWQTDELFFSTATANLRAVKDAWRNPTMHVERRYNHEEAGDVWNAVRAFMRHLATKLSE